MITAALPPKVAPIMIAFATSPTIDEATVTRYIICR